MERLVSFLKMVLELWRLLEGDDFNFSLSDILDHTCIYRFPKIYKKKKNHCASVAVELEEK